MGHVGSILTKLGSKQLEHVGTHTSKSNLSACGPGGLACLTNHRCDIFRGSRVARVACSEGLHVQETKNKDVQLPSPHLLPKHSTPCMKYVPTLTPFSTTPMYKDNIYIYIYICQSHRSCWGYAMSALPHPGAHTTLCGIDGP